MCFLTAYFVVLGSQEARGTLNYQRKTVVVVVILFVVVIVVVVAVFVVVVVVHCRYEGVAVGGGRAIRQICENMR